MTYSDALAIPEPIHLVVTRANDRGERDLLGTYALEWRHVLTEEKGKWSSTVELSGVGLEARISSGLLELALEVFPKSTPLQTALLAGHLETERRQSTERERLFLVYSKQWWREFLQIRSEHGQRMVKIFAQDETGRSRSVCSFVRPLRAGRLLDGPRQAARFVSLIPFERVSSCVGAGRGVCADIWSSLHTLLSRRKGVGLPTYFLFTSLCHSQLPRTWKTTASCCAPCSWAMVWRPMCVWARRLGPWPTAGWSLWGQREPSSSGRASPDRGEGSRRPSEICCLFLPFLFMSNWTLLLAGTDTWTLTPTRRLEPLPPPRATRTAPSVVSSTTPPSSPTLSRVTLS